MTTNPMTMNRLRPTQKSGPGWFLWKWAWTPVVMTAAFGPLLLLNIAQILSLLILPFSRVRFRRLNTYMAWCVWGWWVWGIRHAIGVRITYEGDTIAPGTSALVIANHQGMADIIALLAMAWEQGQMRDVKWMAKNVLKHVPLFGWAMQFVDFVFLKRNWLQDKANIMETFRRYRERPDPFWLLIFPEGTRIRPEKLVRSNAHARKAGLPPTSHVMLPRARGFSASLKGLEGKVTEVIRATVYYEKRAPSLVEVIRGDVDAILVHVKRIPVSEIPAGDKETVHWLNGQFYEMDRWLGERQR